VQTTLITIGLIVSILICFALPIVPLVLMQRRKQHIARPFLAGVVAFIAAQAVHIPLLQMFGTYPFFQSLQQAASSGRFSVQLVLYGLFMGLMAGLCEEFARFIACRWALKENRRYADAVAYGFGHGGCEAVLLVGLTLISSLVLYLAMVNGTLDQLLNSPVAAAQVRPQLEALTPLASVAGGAERISAVCIHLGLSVMVFTGFSKGKPWLYLLFAILAHTAVDAFTVIAQPFMSVWALEGWIAVLAALLLIFALRGKANFPAPPDPALDGRPEAQ